LFSILRVGEIIDAFLMKHRVLRKELETYAVNAYTGYVLSPLIPVKASNQEDKISIKQSNCKQLNDAVFYMCYHTYQDT